MKQLVYIINTEATSPYGWATENVWTYNAYYAKMYAAAFMSQESSQYEYRATISQCDPDNAHDINGISFGFSEKSRLRIVTNLMGEQFLITKTMENNAYNMGAMRIISNKYLEVYSAYFNKNGAGALFATVHSVNTLLKPILKNKTFLECIGNLFEWMLNENGTEPDYFTYCTLVNDRIKKFKIGASANTERRDEECYM